MRGNANCWDAAITMATSITSSNQNEGGGLEPPSCSERLDETKISADYESVVLISDGTAGKMCDHDEELVAKRFDDASPSTAQLVESFSTTLPVQSVMNTIDNDDDDIPAIVG